MELSGKSGRVSFEGFCKLTDRLHDLNTEVEGRFSRIAHIALCDRGNAKEQGEEAEAVLFHGVSL